MRNLERAVNLASPLAFLLIFIPLAEAEQGQTLILANDRSTVLTLDLIQGDAVDFSWTANASVELRVQNLPGTVIFPARVGQIGSGNLQIPTDGTYTFQFRNPNPFAVTVQWTINRTPAPSPFPAVLIVAILGIGILAAVLFLFLRRRQPPSRVGPLPP